MHSIYKSIHSYLHIHHHNVSFLSEVLNSFRALLLLHFSTNETLFEVIPTLLLARYARVMFCFHIDLRDVAQPSFPWSCCFASRCASPCIAVHSRIPVICDTRPSVIVVTRGCTKLWLPNATFVHVLFPPTF